MKKSTLKEFSKNKSTIYEHVLKLARLQIEAAKKYSAPISAAYATLTDEDYENDLKAAKKLTKEHFKWEGTISKLEDHIHWLDKYALPYASLPMNCDSDAFRHIICAGHACQALAEQMGQKSEHPVWDAINPYCYR